MAEIVKECDRNYRGLGQGLLVRFLREFLFADPEVESCAITPEVSNRSAIRAY